LTKNGALAVLTLSGKRTLWQNLQACRNWCIFGKQNILNKGEWISTAKWS
jgi:hypothetical protein